MKEKESKKHDIRLFLQGLDLAIALFVLWVILSGKFEFKLLLMGIIFSIIVAIASIPALTVENNKTGKKYYYFNVNWPRFIAYLGYMAVQITMASLDVMKATLVRKTLEPRVIYFKMDFENPVATSILADSIIVTPGTITLDVTDDGVFCVHALTKNAADGVLDGTMQKKVAKLYNEECEFVPYPEKTLENVPKEVDL